jgi:hypothetical protein
VVYGCLNLNHIISSEKNVYSTWDSLELEFSEKATKRRNLVGGLEHGILMDFNGFFHHIGNVIIPTDELTFFRGVGQPPTRWIWLWLG